MLALPDRYFSSHALVFFFMHFDGAGLGLRLKKYFDAIHEERKLWASFEESMDAFNIAIKKYQAELDTFKKRPGVQDIGNGMIRYPSSLTPPTAPKLPEGP